jgi:hypothetical protein
MSAAAHPNIEAAAKHAPSIIVALVILSKKEYKEKCFEFVGVLSFDLSDFN